MADTDKNKRDGMEDCFGRRDQEVPGARCSDFCLPEVGRVCTQDVYHRITVAGHLCLITAKYVDCLGGSLNDIIRHSFEVACGKSPRCQRVVEVGVVVDPYAEAVNHGLNRADLEGQMHKSFDKKQLIWCSANPCSRQYAMNDKIAVHQGGIVKKERNFNDGRGIDFETTACAIDERDRTVEAESFIEQTPVYAECPHETPGNYNSDIICVGSYCKDRVIFPQVHFQANITNFQTAIVRRAKNKIRPFLVGFICQGNGDGIRSAGHDIWRLRIERPESCMPTGPARRAFAANPKGNARRDSEAPS